MTSAMAGATTWNVTTSSNLQSVINGASAGDTISFAAGTYNVGGSLTGKCGITYTGPVIPITQYTAGDGLTYWGYYGQTAILNGTFRGSNSGSMINFTNGGSWGNPCTQPTVIQYLSFMNVGGIYMQASYTNVSFQYNNFGNIPGQTGPNPGSTAIYLDGGNQSSNTAQTFTNIVIQWNRIGDVNSCLSPTNAFADVTSPDGDGDAGGCNGTIINSTLNGVSYLNNNFLHVSEGTHINCPGGGNPGQGASPCEPSANGATTRNLKIWYNDFSQTHRMDWEEQPQTTSGVDAEWNTMHDKLNTPGFSFGWSFACCIVGSTAPAINVASNVIAWNLPANGCSGTGPYSGNGTCNSGSRYGYGIEAWGNNGNYNNNYLGTYWPAAQGITWGWDGAAPSAGLYSVSNNTICNGNQWAGQQYSGKEVSQSITPPVQTGNNFTAAYCTAVTSTAPSMALSGNTVTFTDAGYSSGPQPLGNTGIWYTTDGTTPVAGTHGSYASNGGSISISTATTIKALGMWGAQNQTTHYASGLAFVPSAVITQTFSPGTPTTQTPVFSPAPPDTFTASVTVTVTDSSPSATIYCTTNGTTPTTSSPVYSSQLTFTATTTLQCIASAPGLANSLVASGVYTLAPPPPPLPLQSCYQGNTTPFTNTLNVGQTIQQVATCQYAGPTTDQCSPGPDANGSSVSTWEILTTTGVVTIGAVGSAHPGLVTAVGPGTVNTRLFVTQGGVVQPECGQWTWTVNATPAATPTLSPASGTTFSSTLSVTIADTTPSSTIYYTTDGSTPTTASTVYTGAFTVNSTTTVNAIAASSGYTNSAVGTATYSLLPTAAVPTFSPVSGTTFGTTLSVSIADTTSGSSIYYTTNGSTPTTSSTLYTGAFTISATSTVKAIATASGFSQSAVGSATYTLNADLISSVAITTPGNQNYVVVGGRVQMTAVITYADATQTMLTTVGVADSRGNSITSWNPTGLTGSGTVSTAGIFTGVSLGGVSVTANVTNFTPASSPFIEYVSPSAGNTLSGGTMTGGTIP